MVNQVKAFHPVTGTGLLTLLVFRFERTQFLPDHFELDGYEWNFCERMEMSIRNILLSATFEFGKRKLSVQV